MIMAAPLQGGLLCRLLGTFSFVVYRDIIINKSELKGLVFQIILDIHIYVCYILSR